MNLLMFGGTRFVGKWAAQAALDRGHQLTLVHRNPTGLFPTAEHVLLDRTAGPTAPNPLRGREFDGLIDVSAYVPRVVRESAAVLGDGIGHAVYVSTVSVYAPPGPGHSRPPVWEAHELREPGAPEEITGETYGPLKVACEHEFFAAYPTGTVVRPTYVVGPDDYTDRFTYWVRRVSEGGRVLVSEPLDAPMQLIDARDLGAFIVTLLEQRTTGAYDGLGPAEPMTLGDMLTTMAGALGTEINVVPAPAPWLSERGIEVEQALPLLDSDPAIHYASQIDPTPSIAAGLTLRPLEETVRDTAEWDRSRGMPAMGFLTREREAEVLAEL